MLVVGGFNDDRLPETFTFKDCHAVTENGSLLVFRDSNTELPVAGFAAGAWFTFKVVANGEDPI